MFGRPIVTHDDPLRRVLTPEVSWAHRGAQNHFRRLAICRFKGFVKSFVRTGLFVKKRLLLAQILTRIGAVSMARRDGPVFLGPGSLGSRVMTATLSLALSEISNLVTWPSITPHCTLKLPEARQNACGGALPVGCLGGRPTLAWAYEFWADLDRHPATFGELRPIPGPNRPEFDQNRADFD